jgi:uncharacterized surface protein with fasciclin (FAS1) repeats
MMRKIFAAAVFAALAATSASAATIVETAASNKNFTTLVAAVKAAGLVKTLSGAGPFTVLAPTNAAFAALPDGTVANLLKPGNKAALRKVLTCHVIAGDVMAKDVMALVKKGGGKAVVKTVGGCRLTLRVAKGTVHITDENGRTAQVTTADLMASNGVIHVINKVILPK